MRAILSIGLDLLDHPYWLIACLFGLWAGVCLAIAVARDAKLDRLEREQLAQIDAAWWRLQQDVKAQRIHRSARSIVSQTKGRRDDAELDCL